jgi:hypothetical protein
MFQFSGARVLRIALAGIRGSFREAHVMSSQGSRTGTDGGAEFRHGCLAHFRIDQITGFVLRHSRAC